MNLCWPCKRSLHEACRITDCNCTHSVSVVADVPEEPETNGTDKRNRRNKPDAALKDQQSTGRKRAAILYPLNREDQCEWHDASPANPKGGGSKPVIEGCKGNQQARHHGPDYNTLNNEDGNVSRICHVHHNMWHRLNDPTRQPEYLAQFGHKPKKKNDPKAALFKSGLLKEGDEIWADPEDQA